MSTPNQPTAARSDDEDSVYDPNIVHGTVGSWNYIVFHDDEQPIEPRPLGFTAPRRNTMTAYRDRMLNGEYDANKDAKTTAAKAKRSATTRTKRSTTTTKGKRSSK